MITLTKLAIRYLKEQKKRTALTLLGIIISVAMISSIGTMLNSIRHTEQQMTRDRHGSNHGAFVNIPEEKYQYIENNLKISKSGQSVLGGTGYVELNNIVSRIELRGYDINYLELKNIKIEEGNIPVNKDDIVLERWIASQLDIGVGDELVLPVGSFILGDRALGRNEWDENAVFNKITEKSFTVVGLISTDGMSQSMNSYRGLVSLEWAEEIGDTPTITTVFRLSDDIKRSEISSTIKDMARLLQIDEEKVQENSDIIASENNEYNPTVVAVVSFLIVLIVAATIAVIFNSFHIGIMERIRQFGIMRSIGTTPKQIRRLVFIEATILSVISIPLGVIFGYLGTKTLFYLLTLDQYSSFSGLIVITSPLVILCSALVGLMAVYISAFLPALSAGKVAPLNAIFYHRNLKHKEKNSKGGSLIKKLFGIEALLAYKNSGRNKKRLLITAFSLSISIILFIVFSLFTNYAFKIHGNEFGYSSDFFISTETSDDNEAVYEIKDIDEIKSIEGIKEVVPIRKGQVVSFLDENKLLEDNFPSYEIKNLDKSKKSAVLDSVVYGYDTPELEKSMEYIIGKRPDIKEIDKEKGVLIVQNAVYIDDSKVNILPMVDLKIGDTIIIENNMDRYLDNPLNYEIDANDTIELKVMGILEKVTFGQQYPYAGQMNLITTKEVYEKVIGNSGYDSLYINLQEDADYTFVSKSLMSVVEKNPGLYVRDNIAMKARDQKSAREMAIFIYGFIALITLIGILNIINTISTNLVTRIKEFGMLRAVGMSSKSMNKMIRLEAIFSSILGAIIGLILGNILSYYLYTIISGYQGLPFEFPLTANIISIIGTLAVALLASIAPIKRISKMNIMEAIREE